MAVVFKSTKDCVDTLNLHNHIKDMAGIHSYGHCFEEAMFNSLKEIGANVRKTSIEFDVVRGADLRFVFEDSSVLVDIKLLTERSLKGTKKFINSKFKESKNEKDLFFFNLTEGIQVGFCLKYFSALGRIGYCKFEKAVITAVFRCKRNKAAHNYISPDVARHFENLVRVVNSVMIDNGEPAKVSNSFEFRYHKQFEGGDNNDDFRRANKRESSYNRHQEGNRQASIKNETR